MNNNSTTTIRLSKATKQKLLERIICDGYGMRGKSKWILESIVAFLQMPDFHEYVEIAGDMDQLTEAMSIRLPIDLLKRIDREVIEVRKKYPGLEGVKSNIIRASILQKLLK